VASDAPPAAPTPSAYLSWYRPAVLGQLVRIALLAALVMCAGMALLGVGLWSPRLVAAARPYAIVLGGLGAIFGPVSMILRFHRLLMAEDAFLGLRKDGLEIHLAGPARLVAWDDLVGVAAAEAAIELRLRSGEILRLTQEWSGSTRAAVAKEVETTRKRAGLGLIRH
jgi:hypothetical protein